MCQFGYDGGYDPTNTQMPEKRMNCVVCGDCGQAHAIGDCGNRVVDNEWLSKHYEVKGDYADHKDYLICTYLHFELTVRWFSKRFHPNVPESFAVYYDHSMCMRDPTRKQLQQLSELIGSAQKGY